MEVGLAQSIGLRAVHGDCCRVVLVMSLSDRMVGHLLLNHVVLELKA